MDALREYRDDRQFLCDFLKAMSPNWVLKSIAADVIRRGLSLTNYPTRTVWDTIVLSVSRRGIGATSEEVAAMDAQADARRTMLEANPEFCTALARLESAGVRPEWGGEGEYAFRSRCLRLFASPEALTSLEELAATDAGIDNGAERQEAATQFRRWLLQSYHPEWKAYREKWPVVEECPYNTARNDFGRDPNPIHPG